MAVPQITSIVPNVGPSWGGEIVRVTGDNFASRVMVLFSTEVGTVHGVVVAAGADYLDVKTPKGPQTPGPVSVTLRNLDDEGEPIPGEEITLGNGYTYQRADIVAQSHLARLIRELLRSLKREVLAATSMDVAVDFDADPEDDERVVKVAEVPAIVLTGPRARKNNFLRRVEPRQEVVQGANGPEIVRRGPTLTYDLDFVLTITTKSTVQLANLIPAIAGWLSANRWLYMLRDATDPDAGRARWPLDAGEFRTGQKGQDDLRVATAEITVRGFNLDDGRPLDRSKLVEEVLVDLEQKD